MIVFQASLRDRRGELQFAPGLSWERREYTDMHIRALRFPGETVTLRKGDARYYPERPELTPRGRRQFGKRASSIYRMGRTLDFVEAVLAAYSLV